MKVKFLFCWILIIFAGCLSGCDITTEGYTTLLDAEQAPATERGGVATGNRFFIASGNQILELLPQPDGTHQTSVIYECGMAPTMNCIVSAMAVSGSKIYAACTALNGVIETLPARSDLIRIDLDKAPSDPGYRAFTSLGGYRFYPNGMAVDEKGDIYITNTTARIYQLFTSDTIDAITRVRVFSDDDFPSNISSIKTTALPAAQGGMSPNGIQIQGNRLWFVSMNVLYEAHITEEGLVDLQKVYQTRMRRMFDDFAILSGNVLAITEINAMESLRGMFLPDEQPSTAPSQLTFVSIGSGPDSPPTVKVTRKHLLPDFSPSSATVVNDAEGPALYVTSYFDGGLYRVDITE